MGFKDHFSGHAAAYTASRPSYPAELFAYLAGLAPARDLAWDCATGGGQAAADLAPLFRAVVATDASPQQVARARPHAKVLYAVARAEAPPLATASADLIVAAQALHWLDAPRFFAEARRVGKPGAVLACWCYGLNTIAPDLDAVLRHLYHDVLGPYWPPERRLVEAGYATIPFPFDELDPPPFRMARRWGLPRFLDYLDTWSSAQRYRAATGADALDLVRDDLAAAWGDPGREREIAWPLSLRVGRVDPDGPP
jgi:SAM-dependent methyltransferase